MPCFLRVAQLGEMFLEGQTQPQNPTQSALLSMKPKQNGVPSIMYSNGGIEMHGGRGSEDGVDDVLAVRCGHFLVL